jgi:hypothetical protein
MKQPELDQAAYDAECQRAKAKYDALAPYSANLAIGFELQGWLAAMVETHGLDKGEAVIKIRKLLTMWAD